MLTFPLAFYGLTFLMQAGALAICLYRHPRLTEIVVVISLLTSSALFALAMVAGGGAPGVFAVVLSALALGTSAAFGVARLLPPGRVPRAVAAPILAILPMLAPELALRAI
jgi:hypothetical protein